MIKSLSLNDLEQASGGFDFQASLICEDSLINSDLIPRLNIRSIGNISADVITQLTSQPTGVVLTEMPHLESTPAVPSQLPDLPSDNLPICQDRRGRYAICQEDGVYERWDRYRPQQPAFRSRFINR